MDTYEEMLRRFPTADFSLSAWRAYANGISGELVWKVEESIRGYFFERDVLPVVKAALADRAAMREAHESFLRTTDGLQDKMVEKLGFAPDAGLIFYLGLCSGAGWATELDGRAVVLLGVETIIELGWTGERTMCGLITHELGHCWHAAVGVLRRAAAGQGERSVLQLYREGVAMRCEQLILGDDSAYHQDRDGWLMWCRENDRALKHEFLRRVRAGESTQDFFGDWESVDSRSDVGYYLGCEFVRAMQHKYSLPEIAKLETADILGEFVWYAG
jgi:hypothetical protein